jgi:hypothetical protein
MSILGCSWRGLVSYFHERFNTLASSIIEKASEEKNPAACRLGGLKGEKVRAEKLSPERRKEITQKAAASLWRK